MDHAASEAPAELVESLTGRELARVDLEDIAHGRTLLVCVPVIPTGTPTGPDGRGAPQA
jgi:hypothetical protein